MDLLSVFLIAASFVSIHRRPVVVSDYEYVINSAAASISLSAAVACRTLAATMAKPMGVPFAIVVVNSAALHYSFLEDKSCRSGCATAPNNFAGEILGSLRFDKGSRPALVTGTDLSDCSIDFRRRRLGYRQYLKAFSVRLPGH